MFWTFGKLDSSASLVDIFFLQRDGRVEGVIPNLSHGASMYPFMTFVFPRVGSWHTAFLFRKRNAAALEQIIDVCTLFLHLQDSCEVAFLGRVRPQRGPERGP